MRVEVCVGDRYEGLPEPGKLGIAETVQLGNWFFGADHPDATPMPVSIPWGKAYRYHWETMVERVESRVLATGRTAFLNFEPGRRASLLRSTTETPIADRVAALRFGGGIYTDLVRHHDIDIRAWFGMGWLPAGDGEAGIEQEVANDLAATALMGSPGGVGISAYGRVDLQWMSRVYRAADRAKNLHEAGGPKPVVFISPIDAGKPDLDREAFWLQALTASKVARSIGADVIAWDDPGKRGVEYKGSRAEMMVEVVAGAYKGIEGFSLEPKESQSGPVAT